MYNPAAGDSIETLDTPSMVIDLDIVESNIARLVERFRDSKVALRPHLKTAKCPELARKMLEAGITGFCVAKVSEAEVLADAGIDDLLITTEMIGKAKLKRFARLLSAHPNIKTVVDSRVQAEAISLALAEADAKRPLAVLIDINVGQNRTGVQTPEEALQLAEEIKQLPHLKLVGVQGYEGHLQHIADRAERERRCQGAMQELGKSVSLLRKNGFSISVVTTGGTGTSEFCAGDTNVTELQPGSFIFMDAAYRNAIGPQFGNALIVLATVISRPAPGRAVVDAGHKSLSNDMGNAEVVDRADLRYRPYGDEYGIIEWDGDQSELSVGDRLQMIPSHIDTTVILHEKFYAQRRGKIEAIWDVACRGKVQ